MGVSNAISKGWEITLRIDEKNYGITLTQIQILSGDQVGQSGAMTARCFKGYGSDGLTAIRATITTQWIHLSFAVEGRFFMLDPLDGMEGYYQTKEAVPSPETGFAENDEKYLPETHSGSNIPEREQSSGNDTTYPSASAYSQVYVDSSKDTREATHSPSLSNPHGKNSNVSGKCEYGDPVYRIADIICASDHEYRDLYPNDWENRITSTVNDLNEKYESQVGISFRICLYYAIREDWIGDSVTTSDLLVSFQDYLNNDDVVKWSPREINHLWTGKDIVDPEGHTPGAAYAAGVRRDVFDLPENYAYGYSEQWHDSIDNLFYIGHEIGHNFNGESAYHAHVEAYWPYYFSTWMGQEEFPFQLGWVLEFSDANKARIKAWASQALDEIRTTNPGYSIVHGGLQSSNIYIQLWDWGTDALSVHEVGKEMFVGFAIANLNSFSLTLEMVFVAARDASGQNRDFGHISNVYVPPGQVYYYHTLSPWVPTSGGTWHMWPGYKIQGHFGPYEWLEMQPTFYYLQGTEWSGLSTSEQDVDLWYNFELLSFSPTVSVGSVITVFCTMFNGIDGSGFTTFTYFFIGARAGDSNRDFGHSGEQVLAMDYDEGDPTGAGCTMLVSRIIDASGTWSFWPTYKLDGTYGPGPGESGWPGITITVQS